MNRIAETILNVTKTAARPIRMWIAESPSTRDYQLLWHQYRTHGLRQFLSGNYYDEAFFADHVSLKRGYQKLADIVFDWARPASVCDFGCGNGYLLYFLSQKGVEIKGIEASAAAFKFMESDVKDRVSISDLSKRIDAGQHDLVISTEVAEHLPKRAADTFVENIARSATQKIVFTAARPGQWGDGHINCQPREFWINLFESQGWNFDSDATEAFTALVKNSPEICDTLPWVTDNFMLFIPKSNQATLKDERSQSSH